MTVTTRRRWVELRVADDGPGIPERERAVVADDHDITQLNHASGMGLWLVRRVVEGYDGRVGFERSEMGESAVVCSFRAGDHCVNADADADVDVDTVSR